MNKSEKQRQIIARFLGEQLETLKKNNRIGNINYDTENKHFQSYKDCLINAIIAMSKDVWK